MADTDKTRQQKIGHYRSATPESKTVPDALTHLEKASVTAAGPPQTQNNSHMEQLTDAVVSRQEMLEQTLKRHLQKLREANDALRMVNQFAEGLLRGDSMEKSLEFLLATGKRLVKASVGSAGLRLNAGPKGIQIHDTDQFTCQVNSSLEIGDKCPDLMENIANGITINNNMSGKKFPPGHIPITNLLTLGVKVKGGQAYLILANKDGGFTDEDRQRLNILSRLISLTIDRRQMDEELRKHQAHLEELVATRTAELKLANQRLRQEVAERKSTEEKLVIYQGHLRSLASELSLTEERERRQIATGLHDHVGQSLAIAKLKLLALKENVTDPQVTESLDQVYHLIESSIQQIRTLTFELSPPVLYECGFETAVEWLADQIRRQHGLDVRVQSDNTPTPFDNDIRVVLFQAVRELMFNIVKHAQCTRVDIRICCQENHVHIQVQDNGVGFSAAKAFPNAGRKVMTGSAGGFGLFNVRERLTHLGGHMEITSVPEKGTRVTLIAPLKRGN